MTDTPGQHPAGIRPDPSPPGDETTIVHLLRHGEVYNPRGILYGRLPGYHLSEEGRLMAKAAASFLAGRDIRILWSSPLDRALETAAPLAAQFRLDVETDDRLIEPSNHFEGTTFGVGSGALRKPANWRYLYDPFRPSWGEPYSDIAERMLSVMADAARAARGGEAVCVSHQLPIWVARRAAEGRRLWHNPSHRQCALASVTSFSYSGDQVTGVSYAEPAGASRPQVSGA
ncbi:MAG TPA: histidine phosphatase family protein [Streptosporangiaceae bacterium]|jgi:broad specificity phosphatase PhoE|nr:histidine phosphatase family protein [Streptosporangiaceae bacterium]